MTVASRCRLWARGFTLVELVAVMVVLGILAAMGTARFMARKSFDVDAFADGARSMLRFGQKVAIAQNRAVYVRLSSPTIALCYDAACGAGQRVLHPAGSNGVSGADTSAANCNGDGSWYCAVLPADISYTMLPAAPFATNSYFFFDQKGKPYASADTGLTEDSTMVPVTIRITGAGETRDVRIERETGYVD